MVFVSARRRGLSLLPAPVQEKIGFSVRYCPKRLYRRQAN
jgi:hypothetical protein